jgi:hypothetical protein
VANPSLRWDKPSGGGKLRMKKAAVPFDKETAAGSFKPTE